MSITALRQCPRPPRSTRLTPRPAARPQPPAARLPTQPHPRPTTKKSKTRCLPASTRKRKAYAKSFLSRQVGRARFRAGLDPPRQIRGRCTHSSLTSGNLLTLFLSLTYDPAPINFRLSPPPQRIPLGAKNTACRR